MPNIEAMVLSSLTGHARFDTTARYFKLTDETRAHAYFASMEACS